LLNMFKFALMHRIGPSAEKMQDIFEHVHYYAKRQI